MFRKVLKICPFGVLNLGARFKTKKHPGSQRVGVVLDPSPRKGDHAHISAEALSDQRGFGVSRLRSG